MAIYFDISGNGTAYAIPSNPSIGEEFMFYAVPFDGDTLLDVTCTDADGYSIAVPTSMTFSMTMPNTSAITFHVSFSGTTPPTPATQTYKKKHMPIWMYPILRR